MRISLIDVDSKIPNLALMKLSAYHKKKGDTVGFNLINPDKIYASIVFRRNKGKANNGTIDGVKRVFGGSGYSLSVCLPKKIEFIKPDYDLYPSEYSQGFITRGCVRACHFCIVPEKEGKLVRWQHPRKFHDDRFDSILVMDNNWLADREWFFETSAWLKDRDLKVMEQGLDIRLIDEKVIDRLQDLRIKIWHFAFDFRRLESVVRKKVRLLQECGISTKNSCDFYVYCHDDLMFDDALYRVNLLRSLGASAFFMFNCDRPKTQRIRDLTKWCNRKCLFWSVPFDEYSRLKHT